MYLEDIFLVFWEPRGDVKVCNRNEFSSGAEFQHEILREEGSSWAIVNSNQTLSLIVPKAFEFFLI